MCGQLGCDCVSEQDPSTAQHCVLDDFFSRFLLHELLFSRLIGSQLILLGQVNRSWRASAFGSNEVWQALCVALKSQKIRINPGCTWAAHEIEWPTDIELNQLVTAQRAPFDGFNLPANYPTAHCTFKKLLVFSRLAHCSSCTVMHANKPSPWCNDPLDKIDPRDCQAFVCKRCKQAVCEDCFGVDDIECSRCPDFSNWCMSCFEAGRQCHCDCSGTDSWHHACGRQHHCYQCSEAGCGQWLCEICGPYHDC